MSLLYFLPNPSPSPYAAPADWHRDSQPPSESRSFQPEFMLSNVKRIFPIISNDTRGRQEGGINEKSGL